MDLHSWGKGAPGEVALGFPGKSILPLPRIMLQSGILNIFLTQPNSEKSQQNLPASKESRPVGPTTAPHKAMGILVGILEAEAEGHPSLPPVDPKKEDSFYVNPEKEYIC